MDCQYDDSTWELPSFDEVKYGERRHEYVLVIPVINEGKRIQEQLRRIQAAELPVDVVIADGGSTDGSLNPDYMQQVDVAAVITKTGPGRLSAQLRMAYVWCIRQGYAGIVTIDGNGKDGVEAVAHMVAKLENGFDYVQGSRYAPGGVAENTPLERTVANRLIHAPLLSLAGRHWFTDTTNGFRAYSVRYLTDPRVRPFRDEFQRYGLLFYLTVRAGQLGFKVAQVPVARRYPANERVPTKIGGLTSKLSLLGEAVLAATGGYTPDDAAPPANPRWFWPILVSLLAVLPLFVSFLVASDFSPDSWAYYEFGQTVFGDFYVAFLAFAIFALLSELIGRRAFGTAWLGLSMALLQLLGPGMLIGEMAAGRAIPLQLVFFAIILLGLLRAERMTVTGATILGLVSGLAVLNRFDAIMLPLFTAAAIWWIVRRPTLAFVALVGAAVAVSPWIIYSLTTSGVLFASDNSGVAMALDSRAFVTDWWPVAPYTLGVDPAVWFARVSKNAARFGFYLALSLAVLAVAGHFAPQGRGKKAGERHTSGGVRIIALFAAIMLALLVPQILAGYFDARYFTAFLWAVSFATTGWLVLRGKTVHQRQIFTRIVFAVIAAAVLEGVQNSVSWG